MKLNLSEILIGSDFLDHVFVYKVSDYKMCENIANDIMEKLMIKSFNCLIYDMEETSVNDLIEELTYPSMFDEKKLIIIKNITFSEDEKSVDKVLSSLEGLKEDTFLLIYLDDNVKITSAFVKKIKKYATINEVKMLDESNLKEYIKKYFQYKEMEILEDAILYLEQKFKNNSQNIYNELEKIYLYNVEKKSKITIDMVDAVICVVLEDNVYELIQYYNTNDLTRVWTIYNDLIEANEDEMRILGAISSSYRQMLVAKELINKGFNKDDIANYFNVKPGRAYYIMKSVTGISLKHIKDVIKRLLDLDCNIKMGNIDKKTGLELFLLCK